MGKVLAAIDQGGFNFDLCRRNELLMSKYGFKPPTYRKTSTTIVGLVFQDGIILGADTRATEGPIVADKNCEKIHYMAPNIYCCGAGTACRYEAILSTCYQGHVSAALVLGGVDITGPHLHTIYPHGSTNTLPYATMGSSSLAAMAMFESNYKEGLSRDEGIKLVCQAICAGIFNDLGIGSNVDVCVITKGKMDYLIRNYQLPNPRTYVSSKGYSFARGQIEVLSTRIIPLMANLVLAEGDEMEE
ncbi:hypothetical protein IFM89_016935 [Coptis chinensis]|uniref:Proteasome subunit beta n=1 Tax=Coptis chinensis TaxID=261450 RepID=A0A835LEM5_9MAGN|nr:hypothetical protein IFM89_016935 [Coptis chinensis]